MEAEQPGKRLPVFCYANWSRPNAGFQQEHFGRVVLSGDELLKYCLWHGGLGESQAAEWEKLLSALHPGDSLKNQLATFEFSGPTRTNSNANGFGKNLIQKALDKKP